MHEFLSAHRAAILDRARAKVAARSVPKATEEEIRGVPLFLDQLIAILRSSTGDPVALNDGALLHGADLLQRGFTVAQVVHDYGGVCQAVTELAVETGAPITADEFRVFNGCLDDAIAQAVTGYARQRDRMASDERREHLGEIAHELRNAVGAAVVAFEVIRLGKAGLEGATAGLLDRSLQRIRSLVDGALADVRLASGAFAPERVSVRALLVESAVGASMEAHARELSFSVMPGDAGVDVRVDRAMLAAALANLLQNAFKFSRPKGHVALTTSATERRVQIEVGDECGGLPPGKMAELFPPFEQQGADRSGLGLGLSIARKSVEASGGEIHVRDIPGTGCVFTIDLPRLAPE